MPGPVVIFTIGTEGDVRPCVALGQGLLRSGYPVRIATSANFAPLVRGAGLEFRPLTANFQAMLETDRSIANHGLRLRAIARIFRERYQQWAKNWAREGWAASEGAELLVGVSNSILLAKALAEARRLPFAVARLQPMTCSGLLPPIMLPMARRQVPALVSRGAFYLIFKMLWDVMRPAVNDIVRPQLGLPRYPWYGPYFRDLHRAKAINGFSRHVLPRPRDWPETSQVTGYWFLDHPRWAPSTSLHAFLAAGPKPVYIGFGSMVSPDAKEFTRMVLEGVAKSGRRAVLATGWGALDGEASDGNTVEDACGGVQNERIYFLRQAPHDGLLPLMSAAVHHGGAGTVAAAARAGIPSVIVPFFGDQPFWAHCLARRGAAPPALERKTLSAGALAAALRAAKQPEMIEAAAALGRAIRAENGVGEAIRWLREWDLLPSPAASTKAS